MVIFYNGHHLKDDWENLSFINHAKGLRLGAFVQACSVVGRQTSGTASSSLSVSEWVQNSNSKILISYQEGSDPVNHK